MRVRITIVAMEQQWVLEICALLGFHAASSGDSVPKFRDDLSVLSLRLRHCLTLEDGIGSLPRNFGGGLPLYAA
jgi:hypothetical protein